MGPRNCVREWGPSECTHSLLDLVHSLGTWLGRWVDLPVLLGLLPQVGADSSGIAWRMRRAALCIGGGFVHS